MSAYTQPPPWGEAPCQRRGPRPYHYALIDDYIPRCAVRNAANPFHLQLPVGSQPLQRILTHSVIRHALHRHDQPPENPACHISRTVAGQHTRLYPSFQHNICAYSNISVVSPKSSICLDSQSTSGGNRPWQTTRMLRRSHLSEFSNETKQGLPASLLTAVYE